MTASRILMVASLGFAIMALPACKRGDAKVDVPPEAVPLMDKRWTYDAEASRTANLTKAGEATGIKNLKDIKLGGDVKTIVDFFSEKSLRFYAYGQLMYEVSYSMGDTEHAPFSMAGKTLTLYEPGNQDKSETFTVQEASANKLVLVNDRTRVVEIYAAP